MTVEVEGFELSHGIHLSIDVCHICDVVEGVLLFVHGSQYMELRKGSPAKYNRTPDICYQSFSNIGIWSMRMSMSVGCSDGIMSAAREGSES